MLVNGEGRACGTVGGGRVEEAAIKHAPSSGGPPKISCE